MSHTEFKIIVFAFMALITYNLFRGLYFLVTAKEGGHGTVRSLSWRIGLSIGLFLLLIVLKLLGIIEPHGLNEQASPANVNVDTQSQEGKSLDEIQRESGDGRVRLKQ